ncbi:uncharacterized protein [Amphiura filiformis]|uniref:uncharacterized protein n=1 Tax=Amphiura filiformis TaxID=82378 RepID=UPI003B226D21
MATTKPEIRRIRYILDEATDILSESLETTKVLRSLKAKHIFSDSEVASINSYPQQDERVDRLLTKLKRKEPRAYEIFLEVLHEERIDLYNAVKEIQEQYDKENHYIDPAASKQLDVNGDVNQKRPKATAVAAICIVDRKVTDKDIRCVTSKVKLLENQLKSMFTELDLEAHEIEGAQRNADTTDYKLQADKVLQYWRSKRGGDATRNAIIHGLNECEYTDAIQLLQEMWKRS